MSKEDKLTAERLRELLIYDPATGVFTWRVARRGTTFAGDVAGTIEFGYRKIFVAGHMYRAHRLAWLYVHGVWPSVHLDHINRVRDDNRIANLREATRFLNNQNVGLRKDSKSGFKGVSWCKRRRRWLARIMVNGIPHNLGAHTTAEAASAAYQAAAAVLHKHNPAAANAAGA